MIHVEVRHDHAVDLLRLDADRPELLVERCSGRLEPAEQQAHRDAEVLAQVRARIGMHPRIDQQHARARVTNHIRQTRRAQHPTPGVQPGAQPRQDVALVTEDVSVRRRDLCREQDLAAHAGMGCIAHGSCVSTDQRGSPRPDNGESACDIGAYEVQDPAGGGGGGGGGGSPLAIDRSETLSPTTFAALRGPTALAARRRYGTSSYALNEAASVRFSVIQPQPGRKARGGRCVTPTKRNRKAGKCTRLLTIPGSFVQTARAGTNRFRFTGRLRGRRLTPGGYRLVATPTAGGKAGRAASASFRIIK